MAYRIVITPEARDQLEAIQDYIAGAASAGVALRFTGGILDLVRTLAEYPHRGAARDDLQPGLRTLSWRRRVTVAYLVDRDEIVVLGIFYGGQDFEALLSED